MRREMKDWILSWGFVEWVMAVQVLLVAAAAAAYALMGQWLLSLYPTGTAAWTIVAWRWWRRLRRYEECARWEPHLHPEGCTPPCPYELPGRRGEAVRRLWGGHGL